LDTVSTNLKIFHIDSPNLDREIIYNPPIFKKFKINNIVLFKDKSDKAAISTEEGDGKIFIINLKTMNYEFFI
jgi:hypothetical protein